MKALSCGASVTALAGGITNDQWLLIIGILITVLNMVLEYMKSRKDTTDG